MLDYRSTGWLIDPAPGACFTPKFISLVQVVPEQYSLTVALNTIHIISNHFISKFYLIFSHYKIRPIRIPLTVVQLINFFPVPPSHVACTHWRPLDPRPSMASPKTCHLPPTPGLVTTYTNIYSRLITPPFSEEGSPEESVLRFSISPLTPVYFVRIPCPVFGRGNGVWIRVCLLIPAGQWRGFTDHKVELSPGI